MATIRNEEDMGRKFRHISFLLIFFIFLAVPGVMSQSEPTITESQRDTLLLMTARENPNFDICFVIDISGSMKGMLEHLKMMSEKALDLFARPGDTVILVKFDHFTRQPLIQKLEQPRDLDLFRGWIRKIETTQGFGTDIRSAYSQALSVLGDLNEARRKKGEPLRIQHIIFVSDGDDIPPALSPFRNPNSKESVQLEALITRAEKEKFINIIPLGMKFKGYKPEIKTYQPGHVPDTSKIDDPEVKKFIEQMKDILQRSPTGGIAASTRKIPQKDYRFYIDWLSDKVSLVKASQTRGSEKNSWVYSFTLKSGFRFVDLSNVTATANYTNATGKLKGRISSGPKVTSTRVKPGDRSVIEVTVQYPQNWSFKSTRSSGNLHLTVSGDMQVELDEEAQPSPSPRPTAFPTAFPAASSTASPSASPAVKTKKVAYTFPFNTCEIDQGVDVTIPVEKTLYLYSGLGILALILIPFLLVYNILVPITVTLKTDKKARAFRLAHKGRITIGGAADFEVDGCSGEVAEIQRRFRRFVLVEKEQGVIPPTLQPKGGTLSLKLGEGFGLNLGGSYAEFEFLPGNQEYAEEKADEADYDSAEDTYEEDFKF